MPDTLWGLIQEVPHTFALHEVSPGDVRRGTSQCPRCRLEAWHKQFTRDVREAGEAARYWAQIKALGVPQEAPAGKREEP